MQYTAVTWDIPLADDPTPDDDPREQADWVHMIVYDEFYPDLANQLAEKDSRCVR
jgi:hypothetical protein